MLKVKAVPTVAVAETAPLHVQLIAKTEFVAPPCIRSVPRGIPARFQFRTFSLGSNRTRELNRQQAGVRYTVD